MNVLLAPDKFRGSLTARQVTDAMLEGVQLARPEAHVTPLPLADGGEGTAQVLTDATGGTWQTAVVSDALGRPIEAGFGLSGDGQTAFIEMAQASGLHPLQPHERNPLLTTTYGTGELIRQAIDRGARHVVLAIGGSATNDGGIGMANALGWQFLDSSGQPLFPIGQNLSRLDRIVPPPASIVAGIRISVACDVANPLFGPEGAAHVYAPQKGASFADVLVLDEGLQTLARLIRQQFGANVADVPGAGAAGGLGAGALFFLNAQLRPGADVVLDAVGFDWLAANADLILTGEGKLDGQTAQGKLIKRVVERAGGVPVVALCGTLALDPTEIRDLGLTAAFSILNRPQTLSEAMTTTHVDVCRTTFNVCRLFT